MNVWIVAGLVIGGGWASAAFALPSVDLAWERVASPPRTVQFVLVVTNDGPVAVTYRSCDFRERHLAPDGKPFRPTDLPGWCDVVARETLPSGGSFNASGFSFDGGFWREQERATAPEGTYVLEAEYDWWFLGVPRTAEARASFAWP